MCITLKKNIFKNEILKLEQVMIASNAVVNEVLPGLARSLTIFATTTTNINPPVSYL